jgi:hypothetical protein
VRPAFAQLLSLLLLPAIVVFPSGCNKSPSQNNQRLTFQLTSNSMSPSLQGPYWQATCNSCGHTWKIASETLGKNDIEIHCTEGKCQGNCSIAALQPGQQVAARRLAAGELAERLSCIVFDEAGRVAKPQESSGRNSSGSNTGQGNALWSCKRVWGLPGERIELRDGEMLINDAMFQKDANQFLRVAIPVAVCQELRSDPKEQFSYRWLQAITTASPVRGSHNIALQAGESIDWNEKVFDDYPEDYSTPRNLADVNDIVLAIEFTLVADPARVQFQPHSNPVNQSLNPSKPWPVQLPANVRGANHDNSTEQACNGILKLEVHYHGVKAEIYCHFGDHADFLHDGETKLHNIRQLWCGGWDNQLTATENPELRPALQLSAPLQAMNADDSNSSPLSSTPSFSSTRFSLTVLRGSICIQRMTLLRDLYLRANERDLKNGLESWKLGDDEMFVIGDNLPISIDSRNGLGNVMRQQIWGVLE